MKRLLIAVFVLAAVVPAFAQQGPGGPPPRGQELSDGPPPIAEAAHNAVVRFLQLSEEQVMAWDEIYWIHRDAEQPLKEEIAALQAEIDALFEAGDPDPTELGVLMIERRELAEALIDVHVVYHEAFVALLDDEQLGRLGFIARADRVEKIIPAFKLFELIRRR